MPQWHEQLAALLKELRHEEAAVHIARLLNRLIARANELEKLTMATLTDIQNKVAAAQAALTDLSTRATGAVTPAELDPIAQSLDQLVTSIKAVLPSPAATVDTTTGGAGADAVAGGNGAA